MGRARLVLRVHASNFTQSGFVEVPDVREVAELAHRQGAIVVDDLGSGALLDTARFGLAHEPMPTERLAAGSDVVTFSGDKLVGGPQAGLVVGRADLVAKMRKDPLARAMRPDKATLAAVAATLGIYSGGQGRDCDPCVEDDRRFVRRASGPGGAAGWCSLRFRLLMRRSWSSDRPSAAARCLARPSLRGVLHSPTARRTASSPRSGAARRA